MSCYGLCGPQYDNRRLRTLLGQYFGDLTFDDLSNNAIVVATRLDTREAAYFSKRKTPKTLIADAAWASTAAQTYFPPVEILTDLRSDSEHAKTKEDSKALRYLGFADGGVSDNSPLVAAMLETMILNKGSLPDDFLLVSIGTGKMPPKESRYAEVRFKGFLGLTREVINQSIEGTSSSGAEKVRDLTKAKFADEDRFFQFQLTLNPEIEKMDDPGLIPILLESAENYLSASQGKKTMKRLKNKIDLDTSAKKRSEGEEEIEKLNFESASDKQGAAAGVDGGS